MIVFAHARKPLPSLWAAMCRRCRYVSPLAYDPAQLATTCRDCGESPEENPG